MVDESDGLWGVGQRVDEEIGGGERGIEFSGRSQRSGTGGAGEKHHLGVKGAEQAGEALGDTAGAEEENALTIERADRGLDLGFNPPSLRLRDEEARELSVEAKDAGERGLGNGVVIESAEVRELREDSARGGVDAQIGVDAGRFELHPTQVGYRREPRGGDVAKDDVRGRKRGAFFGLGEIDPESDGVGRNRGEQALTLDRTEPRDGDAEVHNKPRGKTKAGGVQGRTDARWIVAELSEGLRREAFSNPGLE